jgi:hypothetical protein
MTSPEPSSTPIAMTSHELLYLFELADSAESKSNRVRFSLPQMVDESAIAAAGAATLLARGLAFIADDKLVLTAETGLIGYILTHATVWTEIGLSSAGVVDAALLLTMEGLTLLFTPRPLGIFDVLAVEPGKDSSDVAVPLVSAFLDGADDRLAVVRSAAGPREHSAAIMRTAGSRWRAAIDVPRPGRSDQEQPDTEYTETDRARALKVLAEAIQR